MDLKFHKQLDERYIYMSKISHCCVSPFLSITCYTELFLRHPGSIHFLVVHGLITFENITLLCCTIRRILITCYTVLFSETPGMIADTTKKSKRSTPFDPNIIWQIVIVLIRTLLCIIHDPNDSILESTNYSNNN